MAVTLFGIVTLVRLLHPLNATSPVMVTALLELDHTQPSEVVPVAECAAAGNVSNSSRATAASRRRGQMESLLWDEIVDAGWLELAFMSSVALGFRESGRLGYPFSG